MSRSAASLLIGCLLPGWLAAGQKADSTDVRTVGGIIDAVYESISGGIGQPRQWGRFRTLYHANALIMHTQWDPDGQAILRTNDVEGYIKAVNGYTVARGFVEHEIGRVVEQYGTVAHVISVYEYSTEDGSMQGRGVNSFQLFFDGVRYWITSVIWSPETADHPIPDRLLN